MKIIYTLASLGSGGAERVVSLLANKMDEMGHEVEIICLKYDDVYYQTNDSIKVVYGKGQAKNNLSELFWLRKHIVQEKTDVVIAFTEGVYCFTIAALMGTKIPVIASERLDPSAMTWKRNLLKRLLLPYVDWLVVQTRTIKEYFPKRIQKKTTVIFNPVSLSSSPKGEGSGKSEEKMNRIISVARLFPQKNQEMMIRAFAMIANEYPEWELVIYGEGPLRDKLEELVSILNLQGKVLLPGRTDHVIEELQKSKVFCLSSDYEGMSNSMIEAICVGLPIVSTNVSGTEELIEDGVNGYVVPIHGVKEMSLALSKIMSDESLMIQMGETNLLKSSRFELNAIVDEWMSLIAKVAI